VQHSILGKIMSIIGRSLIIEVTKSDRKTLWSLTRCTKQKFAKPNMYEPLLFAYLLIMLARHAEALYCTIWWQLHDINVVE